MILTKREILLKIVVPILCVLVAVGVALGIYFGVFYKAKLIKPPFEDFNPNLSAEDKAIAKVFSLSKYNYNGLDGYRIDRINVQDKSEIVIPSSFCGKPIFAIGAGAFRNHQEIQLATMSSSVKELGAYAFYGCSSLVSVNFGDGLIKIADSVFAHCTSLQSVELPNSVTHLGSNAFINCVSLASIKFSENLAIIESNAFFKCTSLKKLVIPDSVKEIGSGAFNGCSSLVSVSNKGASYIGAKAFGGCTKLNYLEIGYLAHNVLDKSPLQTLIVYSGDIPERAFSDYKTLKNVTLGDGVIEIGREAFSGCNYIQSIIIPKSVKEIGYYAFYGCSSLNDVEIGYYGNINNSFSNCTITNLTIKSGEVGTAFKNLNVKNLIIGGDGKTVILADAFSNESLLSLTIKEGVTSIGASAFNGCNLLTSVNIPDSVTSIERYAFENCTNLSSVKLPNNLKEISYRLFSGCASLTEIIIPNSVQTILSNAFSNTGLTSVVIPKSVQKIEEGAFFTGSLKTVVFEGVVKEMGGTGYYPVFPVGVENVIFKLGDVSVYSYKYTNLEQAKNIIIDGEITGLNISGNIINFCFTENVDWDIINISSLGDGEKSITVLGTDKEVVLSALEKLQSLPGAEVYTVYINPTLIYDEISNPLGINPADYGFAGLLPISE